MKLNPTTLIAAICLLGAGGFMAGRLSAPKWTVPLDWPAETKADRAGGRESRGGAGGSVSERISRDARKERGATGAAAQEDRLAKLEGILRGEDPLARNRALLDYLDQLGPNDFEAAVAKFRELGITEGRLGEYALMLTAWANADPVSALTYAGENTQGGFARDTLLTAWAAKDPEAAVRWAEENFDGDGANPYLAGIIRGLVGTDPTRATELLASMPRSQERGQALEFLLPHILQQGPDATRAWIASLTDDALKNGAIERAARDLAVRDPAGTATWLLANPGEGAQRRIDDVFGIWADKFPQAALAKFDTLPAGDTRTDALRGLVRTAAASDPQSAVSLMNRYPNDVNDDVVKNFVWHSLGDDPGTSLSQISRIGDAHERERTYQKTLEVWLDRDSAAAQAWIQTNPLPDVVRDRIAQRLAGRPKTP